jgi:hypothetical protein
MKNERPQYKTESSAIAATAAYVVAWIALIVWIA